MLDNIEKQLNLEAESVRLGIERYNSEKPMPWKDKASIRKAETELPAGMKLLRDTIEPLTVAIREFIDKALSGKAGRRHLSVSLIENIPAEELAYITSRVCIDSMTRSALMQTVAQTIGVMVQDHINFNGFEDKAKRLYKYMLQQGDKVTTDKHRVAIMRKSMDNAGINRLKWSTQESFRVGEKLIDLFVTASGLGEIVRVPKGKRLGQYELVLKPTEACSKWLEKAHERSALLRPLHLPMVVPPVDWTSPTDGGYLNPTMARTRLIKTRNRNYLEELSNVDMPAVYSAVNAVQATAWRINKKVFELMQLVWNTGGNLGGLPDRRDEPIPTPPSDFEDNLEAAKLWKRQAAEIYERNAKQAAKRLLMSQRIYTANKMVNESAIYFPHALDFRGRIYPIPQVVNPQSDDSGKALLEFAQGKALGLRGVRWLAIHLANLFGVDKVSMDERVQWVRDNEELILDSAEEPLDGERFWLTADKPWCAYAACLEWAGFKKHGITFVSHLPIALDGSCSGLQHFSAMLRDPIGGRAVNLIPSDKPQDIYSEVAKVAQAVVDAVEDKTDPLWHWRDGKIVRKIAKQPVMTLPYGSGRFGMSQMIKTNLRKIDEDLQLTMGDKHAKHLPHIENGEASVALSYVVYDSIGQVVVAARAAMDWLKQVATLVAKHDLPLHWTTPAGLPVLQEYNEIVSQRVECHFGGRRVRLSVGERGDKLNRKKQASGVSPNFVHSLDASHLMLTVNACKAKGIRSFAMIHDSFGTHASDTDELAMTLRRSFVDMYEPDILLEFRNELAAQLPLEIVSEFPPMPAKGNLDLNCVLESHYFFA